MNSSTIFESVAAELGWSQNTQIEVLLRYIDQQASAEAFSDYLAEHDNFETVMQVQEEHTFTALLENGEQVEMALLREVQTGNLFAVDASYVEQDLEVASPFGNGPLSFTESEVDAAQVSPYKHDVFELHVLSGDDVEDVSQKSLEEVLYEVNEGACVGAVRHVRKALLSPSQMAERTEEFGSDPSFFRITQAVLRANQRKCISCEESGKITYSDNEDGKQYALCGCGAGWIEHTYRPPEGKLASEHPVVTEVEIINQAKSGRAAG